MGMVLNAIPCSVLERSGNSAARGFILELDSPQSFIGLKESWDCPIFKGLRVKKDDV
jgi:hypothetical protein